MRGRLLAGPASLADYEVVEMLLFLGIPRRDTKPLAKQLVLRFGGLREVLTAPSDALLGHGVPHRAVDAFRMVVDAVELLSSAEHRAPVTLSNTAALERYLQAVPRSRPHCWSVLLLGSRNQLLGDQPCDGPDADALAGQLLRAALARHATAAILVREAHSDSGVTQDDRALFMPLRERAAALSVVLHDLVVLRQDGRTASLTQSC